MKQYTAVGVMSGTSCDGIDLVLCHFRLQSSGWSFKIERSRTIPYPEAWKQKLSTAHSLDALKFVKLDQEFGQYIGIQIKQFVKNYFRPIDLVASHGHTIFHQPENSISCQIGHGADIAATCRITCITDFRSLNVAVGGQGAPLVPVGDELLFPEYHACLNLGGFSNISYSFRKQRVAYDICPVNIVLNYYATMAGKPFDENGELARSGNLNEKLLAELNALEYYKKAPPKSLGREWVEANMIPVISSFSLSPADILRTLNEHMALQIVRSFGNRGRKKILVSGGGAYNIFLMERLRKLTHHELIVPDSDIINYKEALIFAFLGILRLRQQVNCYASISGGRFDCSGGAIYEII